MKKSQRTSVQRYHDRVAPRYDQSYDDAYWHWHDALTWDYLKPFLPRNAHATVLDLGCGTGKWAIKLIQSGFHAICIDISAQMLDQCRKKIESIGKLDRAQFIQADLCDLSAMPDECAALAVAFGDPIGCAESPSRALKQIRRKLAPNAALVATFDNRLAALEFYLERGDLGETQRFLRDGKTHWLTKDVEEQFEITTFDPTGLQRLLEQAGYECLEILGKTVLPMRHHRKLLENPVERRKWMAVEKSLCRDASAMGRASHIQVACRPHQH